MDKATLEKHKGHDIEIVTYGNGDEIYNISLECLDCNEVLEGFDY